MRTVMTDFPPNKLVTDLAMKLLSSVSVTDAEGNVRQVGPEEVQPEDLPSALVADPAVPELVTFAGFLGGSFTDQAGRTWRVLYLDPKLVTWLVVNERDIIMHKEVRDMSMPSTGQGAIMRDLLWLRSSASVTEGSGPPRAQALEAQFLRGDFIGAGDFSASLTGGTFSRATGLLCEVQTPGCCGRYTRPRP